MQTSKPDSKPSNFLNTKKMKKDLCLGMMILFVTSSSVFLSCDSEAAQMKKRREKAESIEKKIFTPEDWYEFVNSTSDLSEIDDVIMCMPIDRACKMWVDYSSYLLKSPKNESYSKGKAWYWLFCGISNYEPRDDVYQQQIRQLDEEVSIRLASGALLFVFDKDACDRMTHEYGSAIGKKGGKLKKYNN